MKKFIKTIFILGLIAIVCVVVVTVAPSIIDKINIGGTGTTDSGSTNGGNGNTNPSYTLDDNGNWIDSNGEKVGYKNTLTPYTMSTEEKNARLPQALKEIEEESDFMTNPKKYFTDYIEKEPVVLDMTTMTSSDFMKLFFETLNAKIEARDENMYCATGNGSYGYIKGIGDLYLKTYYNCTGRYTDSFLTDITIGDKYFYRVNGSLGEHSGKPIGRYVASTDLARISMGVVRENYYQNDTTVYNKASDTITFTDYSENSVMQLPNGMLTSKDTEHNYTYCCSYNGIFKTSPGNGYVGVEPRPAYTLQVNKMFSTIETDFVEYWQFNNITYLFGNLANWCYWNDNTVGSTNFTPGLLQNIIDTSKESEIEYTPITNFNEQLSATPLDVCKFVRGKAFDADLVLNTDVGGYHSGIRLKIDYDTFTEYELEVGDANYWYANTSNYNSV